MIEQLISCFETTGHITFYYTMAFEECDEKWMLQKR